MKEFPIAVIMERRRLDNPWVDAAWEAVGVVPAFDDADPAPRRIVDEVERIDYEVFDKRATVPLRRRLAVAGPAWVRARRARGRRRSAA